MRHKTIYFALIIFIVSFLVGWLGNWTRAMKTGTEAYWNQNYDAAVEAFQQAISDKSDHPISLHNLGTALYKKGEYRDAVVAFQQSLMRSNSTYEATVFYNLGNAQFQMRDFKTAIESYESSLRINPHDSDTKHNLALAKQMLKQQQEFATQQKTKRNPKQNTAKNQSKNIAKTPTPQLLNLLKKNENKRRQDIYKQQLNSGYRREKDW